ncbi:phosphatase and actin regulator 3b isoform X2 [Nerophis ophidion]|uniref:phosphatase and actin regulator 3b isoform X2 n=1 Tax=Nerophis ophidion TaxID=159077 RepID=UPI002ADFD10C|nr:phosphatase and actin regulator 3b isoform X2 [Nerophis ophidion]
MTSHNPGDYCVLQRGRSHSDPSSTTEVRLDEAHRADVMEQQRLLKSGCQLSGVRTPPVRRSSKLASLGRIFKPWKWRKKKNEKLKPSAAVEKKPALGPQQDDLIQEELETESDLACGGNSEDQDTPTHSDGEERDEEPMVLLAGTTEDVDSLLQTSTEDVDKTEDSKRPAEPAESDIADQGVPGDSCDENLQVGRVEAPESRKEVSHPQRRASTPPGPNLPVRVLTRLGSLDGAPPLRVKKSPATLPRNFTLPKDPHGSLLRGRMLTPTGSPHLGGLHPQLPPSCIIEELHRALATKHRKDSFQMTEVRASPKRRLDSRLSRASSTERGPGCEPERKKQSDENKENRRLDEYFSDQDSWNQSVISGSLPRRMRKELLAVKLRNRPSQQELQDRNIFPVRSDQERQVIRQQIEMKLAKRLSQRPAVEELESRNILKQRNDQTEQEERREIKQRLNRKLNQRPTVDELRDRKILIRFSDYVEVAKAQDYDRRADKPWTRLSAADKAAIRKELNEFKSTEMEVHSSSKHLTRFHRP